MITIVSATRLQRRDFEEKSPLAASMRRFVGDKDIQFKISLGNRDGLPETYNAQIDAAAEDDILVFMHDDVWIDDYLADCPYAQKQRGVWKTRMVRRACSLPGKMGD